MNTLSKRQQSNLPWQITNFNHPSFNLLNSTSRKQNLSPVDTALPLSNNELAIATEPEAWIIIGYSEFGDNLEIYDNL